jgi:hypothetical protein
VAVEAGGVISTVKGSTLVGSAVVALALAGALAPTNPALVEAWFSTGIYPPIQRTVTPVSNAVPVALLDLLSVAAVVAAAVALVRGLRASRRTRRLGPLLLIAGRLTVAVALGYLVFLMLWGLNYRRVPMEQRLSIDQGAPSPEAVVQLGLMAAGQLNKLYDEAHRSEWPEPLNDSSLVRA